MGLEGAIRRRLAGLDVGLARATSRFDVEWTLESLWPIKTNRELIRLGSDHDGGYVVLDDLEGVTDLFSPGVQDNWQFEEDFGRKTGAKPHLLDCLGAPIGCAFEVETAFLGGFSDKNQQGVNEWIEPYALNSEGDFFLQMDIEGHEYEVIGGLDQRLLRRFRGIVVELHRLDLIQDENWFAWTLKPFIRKILTDFAPVHIHPNNAASPTEVRGYAVPRLLEVTFWRRDRISDLGLVGHLPHFLDQPNVPSLRDVKLWSK